MISKHLRGYLDSSVSNEITIEDIRELRKINSEDKEKANSITKQRRSGKEDIREIDRQISSLPENQQSSALRWSLYKSILEDQQYDGFMMRYPFGNVVKKPGLSYFYRGEKEAYPSTIPSLTRHLDKFCNKEEKHIEQIVADLRVIEFYLLVKDFTYMKEFTNRGISILYDVIAQHYHLKTFFLDITSDFDVALFFACCSYDDNKQQWRPLSRNEIKRKESGVLYQGCQFVSEDPNARLIDGSNQSPVFPVGYQPFFRCSNQYAYAVYLPYPYELLERTIGFRKFFFKHDHKMCQEIFETMEGGKVLYPEEGLLRLQDQINSIASAKVFTEESIDILAKQMELPTEILLNKLKTFQYSSSSGALYNVSQANFDAINAYYDEHNIFRNLQIMIRKVYPGKPNDSPKKSSILE